MKFWMCISHNALQKLYKSSSKAMPLIEIVGHCFNDVLYTVILSHFLAEYVPVMAQFDECV